MPLPRRESIGALVFASLLSVDALSVRRGCSSPFENDAIFLLFLRQVLIAKYKEAQGSIKGLQEQVQELQGQQNPGADGDGDGDGAKAGADPAFGATIAALQTQLREVTEAKNEAVQRAEAAAAAAEQQDKGDDATGGADFGATIAALQTQLREVTQEKDEAVQRAEAAAAAAEDGVGTAAKENQLLEAQEKAHQEALAEKQSQNEQLVQKVRQLLTTCRSLKEQVAVAGGGGAATAAGAQAGEEEEEGGGLQAQLDLKQAENDKLMTRLRELAQRYRALQQEQQRPAGGEEGGGAGGAATATVVPSDVADQLEDAERRVAAADERAADLAGRCEEAEAEHQRVSESLKEAVERLAALDAAAAAAGGGERAEETVAALEARVAGLVGELKTSREEKEEVSTQLEAKTTDFEKMVGCFFFV